MSGKNRAISRVVPRHRLPRGRRTTDDLQVLIDAGAKIEGDPFAAVYGDPANIAVLLAARSGS